MLCSRVPLMPLVVLATLVLLGGCGGGGVSVCFSTFGGCTLVRPPQADAGNNQTTVSGDAVTLDGSDSQGGSLPIASYRWSQSGGPTVVLRGSNEVAAMFTAPDVSDSTTLNFKLIVTDTGGHSDSSTTTVTVEPASLAATQVALELMNTTLLPEDVQPFALGRCPSVAPSDAARLQAYTGLWLTAQVLATLHQRPGTSPSDLLDAARRMQPQAEIPGDSAAVQALGFQLLRSWADEADPAAAEALAKSLAGAADPRAAAGLVDGRARLEQAPMLHVANELDPAAARADAVGSLLGYRHRCPTGAESLTVLGAALKVVAVDEESSR